MAIAKLSIDLEARFAKFEKDLQAFSGKAAQIGSNLTTVFAGIGGVVAAVVGGEVIASFKGLIDSLDKLDESAERVGVSVESLSALNFAGKMNGLQLDDMTGALTKLSVKMQEAAAGGKEASALFGDLGVKVTDSSGRLKSADVVMAEIADRFAQFKDGAAKTALAVDVFGKSGAQLVPLLNGGAAGLEKMRLEAQGLGAIIDSKLAKQAADFNDNLDRLAILASTAGKSIASDLLPWLNKVAEEFLVAQKHSAGFFDSMTLKFPSLQSVDIASELKSAREQLAGLEEDMAAAVAKNKSDGGSIDTSGLEARIGRTRRQLEFYKELQRNLALADSAANYGNEGRSRGTAEDKVDIKRTKTGDPKPKKEVAEATAEATAYAKAMESLATMTSDADAAQLDLTKSQKTLFDLMTSAEWQNMPEAWQKTAIAQFETANAAEKAAEQQKRLNELLGATDSAKIDEAAKDMELLASALEKGTISAAQFLEAAGARLDSLQEKAGAATSEFDEFAKSAARNMQSSLADFLFDPFANGTQSMAAQFSAMIRRMMAEAAAAKIAEGLFGGMGKAGSGDWGLLGKGLSSLGSFFTSPASQPTGLASLPTADWPPKLATGTNYVPRDMLAVIHEGESVIPKAYNPAAGGSGSAMSIVINNNGTPQTVTGQREVVDSRGHRSLMLDMEDAMAAGLMRPGSRLNTAAATPRMIQR